MKTAVFSTKSYDRHYFNKFNTSSEHELTFFEAPLNVDTVNLTVGYEAVCVFVNDNLNNEVIVELVKNGVKVIALRCAGFNNVDLESAKVNGVTVVRVPSYSPQAVAEHAVALILTLNRKTHKAYNRIRESNFSLERLTGFDIYGKTVGVIGTGHIGMLFAKIMLGFGCNVIAYDINKSNELVLAGVEYTDLDDLFGRSDIISLHCPLLPQTFHLINEDSINKMKDGVMLINTSRGALIDTSNAITALKSGKLGYLGIDVYEQEEKLFFKDLSEKIIQDDDISRLMTFPNVLITAHQGFFTREALEEISKTTLSNLSDLEKGDKCQNEVKI
ncbi:2-hydroxyacid dehydrogenase [Marinigracilibium pacificum]|uniref:2-hydroxyacid dehydrogenase n=1 Tax=Marinigracilibium pacificum TaxID=2729599 RepID=A0A848J8X7_9BACT|nr:2-hydroxyacid dehydrogenase [Marinigracilibium pacificum]NMM50884.1 2-hydroxyacid dehydrogenase [Marinigracilibium pacificum]